MTVLKNNNYRILKAMADITVGVVSNITTKDNDMFYSPTSNMVEVDNFNELVKNMTVLKLNKIVKNIKG